MKGRIWLVLGVAAGIAIAVGRLPYFAGAATTLSDTAQRIVRSGGISLTHAAAVRGTSQRVIGGFSALIGILVPGVTALLLIACARVTMRLRVLIALLFVILGVAGYHYLGSGDATGSLVLGLAAAAFALFATGPLVAAPLAALAGLIGAEFLPKLLSTKASVPRTTVIALHQALFATPGAPVWLQVVALVLAVLPFAIAARMVLR
ncbi:MAG TPA: hypothetical protein VK425_00330 [Acidimicrobiales bacterium]|nr:hypothetical protein [Acidimicrobiales bacterium]